MPRKNKEQDGPPFSIERTYEAKLIILKFVVLACFLITFQKSVIQAQLSKIKFKS